MALALMVGMVQGGTQALSRSLFASMIPRDNLEEGKRVARAAEAKTHAW